jgi:hypothetical protein
MARQRATFLFCKTTTRQPRLLQRVGTVPAEQHTRCGHEGEALAGW